MDPIADMVEKRSLPVVVVVACVVVVVVVVGLLISET